MAVDWEPAIDFVAGQQLQTGILMIEAVGVVVQEQQQPVTAVMVPLKDYWTVNLSTKYQCWLVRG